MGEIIGYARVSSVGQSLNSQIDALQRYGCTRIYEEKRSGLDSARPELARALEFAREGDTFAITRLDRLARSTLDLHRIVDHLHRRGVGFVTLDQSIDTTTSEGRLLFALLSGVAEFEANIRRERQADGIRSAQRRNVKFGRPPKVTEQQIAEIRHKRENGALIRELMTEYSLSKSSVYRFLSDGALRASARTRA